jgi:toxin FitB
MTGFLNDTNVVSGLLLPQPDANVWAWFRRQQLQHLFISVVSLGEFRKGLTLMPAGTRRSALEQLIGQRIPEWFAGRILPVTSSIAERWGELEAHRQRTGRPISVPDAQIAATALEHQLTLVTRNTKDFQGLNLPLVNPWYP